MLSPRVDHTAVSSNNKMFIIGGSKDYFELFDSITRKFTYIKTLLNWTRTLGLAFYRRVNNPYQIVEIANNIYLFRMENNKVNIHRYDVRSDFFTN